MKYLTDPTHRVLAAGAAGAVAILVITVVAVRLSPPLGTGVLPPLSAVERPAVALQVDHVTSLDRLFDAIGFAPLKTARLRPVPAVLLRKLPRGFAEESDISLRKRRFVRILLPIVLRVNRTIERQRAALDRLARRARNGDDFSAREQRWLEGLADLYKTRPDDWKTLRLRVIPVPPSLAIAQAATETGWGSSRFAREGNALFGQWTPDGKRALKPQDRDEAWSHGIKTYHRLIDSVWDYARNLNTHRAYRDLRRLRAAGGGGKGERLVSGLRPYSQKGPQYVALISRVIAENDLSRLDALWLAHKPPRGL